MILASPAKLRTAIGQARVRGLHALMKRGNAVECSCCGETYSGFAGTPRPNRRCWNCGSLERHRSLALYLDLHPEMVEPGMRILHVAPEGSLRGRFAPPGVDYVSGDLDPSRAEVRLDVTDLEYPDASFDGVVCNHVLEHVPDDRRAMREMRRVLRSGGWAILLVPDIQDVTDEDPTIDDPKEQERRFGQWDHVRIYGWDYVDRLREAGFDVEVVDMGKVVDAEIVERFRLRKKGEIEPLFICHAA